MCVCVCVSVWVARVRTPSIQLFIVHFVLALTVHTTISGFGSVNISLALWRACRDGRTPSACLAREALRNDNKRSTSAQLLYFGLMEALEGRGSSHSLAGADLCVRAYYYLNMYIILRRGVRGMMGLLCTTRVLLVCFSWLCLIFVPDYA